MTRGRRRPRRPGPPAAARGDVVARGARGSHPGRPALSASMSEGALEGKHGNPAAPSPCLLELFFACCFNHGRVQWSIATRAAELCEGWLLSCLLQPLIARFLGLAPDACVKNAVIVKTLGFEIAAACVARAVTSTSPGRSLAAFEGAAPGKHHPNWHGAGWGMFALADLVGLRWRRYYHPLTGLPGCPRGFSAPSWRNGEGEDIPSEYAGSGET